MIAWNYRYLGLFITVSLSMTDTLAGEGVPLSPHDYSQTVDEWWSSHRLNPGSERHDPVVASPSPIVNAEDFGHDLQKCIDELPAGGGTVKLPAGVYRGGLRIVGRKNLHLIGEGEVVIRGSDNHIIGSEMNLNYGEFCSAVHRRDRAALAVIRDFPTGNILLRNITFEDSPVRLASTRGVLFDRCTFRKAENREVGDVDAGGNKVLRWYRPLAVTGIMGLRDIWFCDCDFEGHHANAIYLDGAHCSGIINCRFAGVDRLWHNAVLLFTNDDLSLDVNGNDRLEPFERRDTSYFVVDGCRFGGGYKRGAIAASGRDILIQNCEVKGPLESLLVINAKTSGKWILYESFGVKVRNNHLDRVRFIVTAEGPANRPTLDVPDWWVWTKYEIGRFEIRDNRVTGMEQALHEIPRDGEILGPHRIENNIPPDLPAEAESRDAGPN